VSRRRRRRWKFISELYVTSPNKTWITVGTKINVDKHNNSLKDFQGRRHSNLSKLYIYFKETYTNKNIIFGIATKHTTLRTVAKPFESDKRFKINDNSVSSRKKISAYTNRLPVSNSN